MTKPDPMAAMRRALGLHGIDPNFAPMIAAAVKSAVRDALPGRQQKRNLDPIIAKATKAAIRTIRRRVWS